jgi:DNA-binding transcriptional LysR family regulator
MNRPDLNLLFTLDALLSEGSVARAAVRLGLSPSAMSRSLARLRTETGDPLLVRAGRGLVPTPRALQLRSEIGPLVDAAEAALRPVALLDVSHLDRTFTLRASEGFVENFGAALLTRVAAEAPHVRLRFVARPRSGSGSGSGDVALRDAGVDLDIGVVGPATGPEVRTQALFRDRFVGVVRDGASVV